jgi:hypothetical protein
MSFFFILRYRQYFVGEASGEPAFVVSIRNTSISTWKKNVLEMLGMVAEKDGSILGIRN